MKYGYARVSTFDQDTAIQIEALKKAGCEVVFHEKQSAVKHRPELEKMLSKLEQGDELCVYKLDRLARSVTQLLSIIEELKARGVRLRSLTEPIDETHATGRLMLQILGSFAEFERNLIRERVIAGQVAAIKRGVVVGGRPKILNAKQVAKAKALREKGFTWPEIGARLGVSNTTARRAVVGDNRDRMVVLKQYL